MGRFFGEKTKYFRHCVEILVGSPQNCPDLLPSSVFPQGGIMFALKYAILSVSRRKKKNLASVLAIALGVALFIGVQTCGKGFTDVTIKASLEFTGNADVTISCPSSATGLFSQSVADQIRSSSDPRLEQILTVAPWLGYGVSTYSDGQVEKGVGLRAIDPTQVGYGSFFDNEDGRELDESVLLTGGGGMGRTMVSSGLADELDLEVGSIVRTSGIPDGNVGYVDLDLEVVSIYDDSKGRGKDGHGSFLPQDMLYIHIYDIQSRLALGLRDSVNTVDIILKDGVVDRTCDGMDTAEKTFDGIDEIRDAIDAIEEILETTLPRAIVSSVIVLTAEETEDNLELVIMSMNMFVYILNATALLLIVNVQSMGVEDRKYQTAVLRALGSDRKQILSVFLIESAFIGAAGAAVGLGLGNFVGMWISNLLSDMFAVEPSYGSLDLTMALTGLVAGITLSILTVVLPALRVSRQGIANALRGVSDPKKSRNGYFTVIIGLLLTVVGLVSATGVGDLTDTTSPDGAWINYENQAIVLLSSGLILAGIGMLLTVVLSRRLALNISAVSIFGLANFFLWVGMPRAQEGVPMNFFTITLFYLIIGSVMLIAVNYNSIMNSLNKLLFAFTGLRAVSQVTTRQMIGQKTKGILVFTIFTLILTLTIMMASLSSTWNVGLVQDFGVRSQGVDVVVSVDSPVVGIEDRIMTLKDRDTDANYGDIENVFAFRRAWQPLYTGVPFENNTNINMDEDVFYWPVIELREEVMNLDNWGDKSLAITAVEGHSEEYETGIGMSDQEQLDLTKKLLTGFFANENTTDTFTTTELNNTSDQTVEVTRDYTKAMILGGFTSCSDLFEQWVDIDRSHLFFRTEDPDNPVVGAFMTASMFDMMGVGHLFAESILVTPEMAAQLPAFEAVREPNLFLVRSKNGFNDESKNEALAKAIEDDLNKLSDPLSLSSQHGFLIGASTTVVKESVEAFWIHESAFMDFFGVFATLGLIIGGLGMIIIAVRSVSERTREIGMMRAIGFSRREVVAGVILELATLSFFGLLTGFANGALLIEMWAQNLFGMFTVPVVYPVGKMIAYAVGVIGIASVAGLIPGMHAARIAPSQALRYTG